jgi:hypothetical protein
MSVEVFGRLRRKTVTANRAHSTSDRRIITALRREGGAARESEHTIDLH